MRDILPSEVFNIIQNHFYAGVTKAESYFRYHSEDEDSLTGALGQQLIQDEIYLDTISGQRFRWKTEYFKFRGRGDGALEKKTGADGIFHIEVLDVNGRSIRKKGLLFQAKKQWKGAERYLLDQAKELYRYSGRAIVINYSPHGYRSCLAEKVVDASGDRKKIRPTDYLKLSKTLGKDFLPCRIGSINLFYDDRERIVRDEQENQNLAVSHIIATRIQQEQEPQTGILMLPPASSNPIPFNNASELVQTISR